MLEDAGTAYIDTLTLLYSISDHLSSKAVCKRREFCVHIYADTCIRKDGDGIAVNYQVLRVKCDVRDAEFRHHTVPSKVPQPVVAHIADCHLSLLTMDLVPGIYMYKLSASGKKRKWIKLKELEVEI